MIDALSRDDWVALVFGIALGAGRDGPNVLRRGDATGALLLASCTTRTLLSEIPTNHANVGHQK